MHKELLKKFGAAHKAKYLSYEGDVSINYDGDVSGGVDENPLAPERSLFDWKEGWILIRRWWLFISEQYSKETTELLDGKSCL